MRPLIALRLILFSGLLVNPSRAVAQVLPPSAAPSASAAPPPSAPPPTASPELPPLPPPPPPAPSPEGKGIEPLPFPSGSPEEPPPDTAPTKPPASTESFGEQGQWCILATSTSAGISSETFSASAASFFNANVAIGVDTFVAPHFSIGIDVEVGYGDNKGYGATTLQETTSTYLAGGVR